MASCRDLLLQTCPTRIALARPSIAAPKHGARSRLRSLLPPSRDLRRTSIRTYDDRKPVAMFVPAMRCTRAASATTMAGCRASAHLRRLAQSAPFSLQRRWASGPSAPGAGGANDYQFGPSNDVQPQPSTQRLAAEEEEEDEGGGKRKGTGKEKDGKGRTGGERGAYSGSTAWKMFESAATTTASLAMLGLAGYGYHKYYKRVVFDKINRAFNEGDPALNLATAASSGEKETWYNNLFSSLFSASKSPDSSDQSSTSSSTESFVPIEQDVQSKIDDIIEGKDQGHYYLLIGEKGTGKTSMLLNAMFKTKGHACSMMEAHADPEIFRIRLGKALDFEFHEDYIGSLFSIRGPRDTTALLDIERAFNKLEKVALERRKASGKPLVMIINGVHMLRDDHEGVDLLELLQQRAEAWAASGLVTMIFNSDDFFVFERMKRYGSRMLRISVSDLNREATFDAIRRLRMKYYKETPSDRTIESIYDLVGGRMAFINKVVRARDMLEKCRDIIDTEKTWLQNTCGLLGSDMDDDVMDQQKFASSAMLLVKALVDMEKHLTPHENGDHHLPQLPVHKARYVMTRADFLAEYDHNNIITIDSRANVRADSVAMMNAFREVCAEEGFEQLLEDTLERIGDIESLGRTKEITLKDLWNGGRYNFEVKDEKGRTRTTKVMNVVRGYKGVAGDDGDEKPEDEGSD